MPAVYNSLVTKQGLSPRTAWRVSFVVPGIVIVFVACCIIFLCPDTPTGKWSERQRMVEPDQDDRRLHTREGIDPYKAGEDGTIPANPSDSEKEKPESEKLSDNESQFPSHPTNDLTRGEVIVAPNLREILRVTLSPQVLVTGACYFCSFGSELAVNIILGNYYAKNFPWLSLQGSGSWAAMFGLMNAWVRPAGGIVGDLAFKMTGSVWSKKILLHFYSIVLGVFLVAIGVTDPHQLHTLTLLVGIGLAFFVGCAYSLSLLP